jgi:hypothetical protein
VDRDESLELALRMAMGFDADVLVYLADSWAVTGQNNNINPVTGAPWEQGDMAKIVEEHDGLVRGLVTETLQLLAVNRAGDLDSLSLAYTVVKHHVQWADPIPMRMVPSR